MVHLGDSVLLQLIDRAYIAGARDQMDLLKEIFEAHNLSTDNLKKFFIRYKSTENRFGGTNSKFIGRSLESVTGRSERFVRQVTNSSNNETLAEIKANFHSFASSYKRKLHSHTKENQRIVKKNRLNKRQIRDEWEVLVSRLRNIRVEGPLWPQGKNVSWDTYPKLFVCLCDTGLIPTKFITSGSLWDPCYLNGNVAHVYRNLGFTVRHEPENFWKVWPKELTRNTYFITNPSSGKKVTYWLTAFFKFVVLFDRPFLLVLPDYICVRKYFRETFGKIRRPCELHIWGLNKSFPMMQKGAKETRGFAGLTIVTYYPEAWKFALDMSRFQKVFT